jgi:hypothetical protein
MALMNTKKTALFLKSGAVLPVAPASFLEVEEELLLTPDIPIEEFKRINGLLGSNSSYADVCHTTISQSISTKMRFSNSAADALDTVPEYGELLKIGGFTETIDATPGAETVIYANTQAPVRGSAVAYIDGKKHQMTDSLVADITMNFPIGKVATITANLSAFLDNDGVAATEANPTVTLNDEAVLITGCADIFTAGGVSLVPDNITIATGADVQEFYGMGRKEFGIQDYMIKVTADFYPENANYNTAVTKLGAGTTEAIVIKLGTNAGTEVNGKTVVITCDTAKASAFSDSADKSTVKRSFTWLLTGTNQIAIKHGFYA